MFKWLKTGIQNKSTASTNINNRSSRSHTLFQLAINVTTRDGLSWESKLNLVDLAGSERLTKSHSEGIHLQEAIKINTSLSVLSKCIMALADGNSHIP